MKGVAVLTDISRQKRFLQIEISDLVKNPQKYEDMIDVIIAEERKAEKSIPWENATKQLKKAGKI
ncbi:MAG TPA: hypothetical protein VK559_06965 [Ferruginibacter sp.]|nr:hypothetical protein [Ferruginibacter sp.]